MMNVDELICSVGEFGRYQRLLLLLWASSQILVGMQCVCYIFTSATPSYRCFVNGYDNDNSTFDEVFVSNSSLSRYFSWNQSDSNFGTCFFRRENTTSYLDHRNTSDQIFSELNHSNFTTQPCDRWIFDKSVYSSTTVTEWNLVCNQALLAPLAQSLLMTGLGIGCIIFGSISDRFGRKTAGIIGIFAGCLLSIVTPFVPYYTLHLLLRLVVGACIVGTLQASFIICGECVGQTYRAFIGAVLNSFFALGEMTVGVLAYFIRNWKDVIWAISAPGFVWIAICLFSFESPRWLIITKNYSKGRSTLKRMAACNGTTIPKHMLELENICVETTTDSDRRYMVWDLFTHSKIRAITLILCYNWFLITLSYYGISMNVPPVGNDPFFSFVIVSAFEIPGYMVNYYLMNFFGRRLALASGLIVSGLAGVATALTTNKEIRWLHFALVVISKFGCAATFGNIFIYTMELYPTAVRNLGTGACGIVGHLGAILSSYVFELNKFYPALPLIVFGIIALVGGCSVVVLPETLGRPLPDKIDDIEDITIGVSNVRNLFNRTGWTKKTSMKTRKTFVVEVTQM